MSIQNSRILIIDDDENLCYLLKEELIDKGFSLILFTMDLMG